MSSVTREEFLSAINEDSSDSFLDLIGRHNCKEDPLDLGDLLSSLSRTQLEDAWNMLQQKCASALLHFDDDDDPHEGNGVCGSNNSVTLLRAILMVAEATTRLADANMPLGLFETVVMLHGILLSLPDDCDKLADSIAALCELWWNREIDGRDELVSQTVVHLLKRCLSPDAKVVDVKRLWKIHRSFTVIDVTDEKSEPLKLLLQCAMQSSLLLKIPEGRKLQADLLTLDVTLIDSLHAAMKTLMPELGRNAMDWVGEVYFRAWNEAQSDTVKEKLEISCIQDFMYCALNAQRGSSKSPSDSLHRLVSYFHRQKKVADVDSMLLRLYEPILWRSLKVANSQVRANAASVLFDVFPLRCTTHTADERDELLRKQFDVFKELADDVSDVVRAICAYGICRIVGTYWEILPAERIKELIEVVVQKHAWDSSSSNVRIAVIKGFTAMVDCRLSHSLLQSVLPRLCKLFHDKNDKVRLAVIDLLLKVKRLGAAKFWTLVPADHMLARLEIESAPVAKRLVSLLFQSYFPENKELDVQLYRAIQLIKKNRAAARKFYLHAFANANLLSSVKFIVYVLAYLAKVVEKYEAENTSAVECDPNQSGVKPDEQTANADIVAELTAEAKDCTSASELLLTMEDTELITGLLDAVVLLWMGIQPGLNKPGAADVKRGLEVRAAKFLPSLVRNFQESEVMEPLMIMAGFLPAGSIPTVSCGLISKLRAFAVSGCDTVDYRPLLSVLCRWKRGNDVLDMITDWLEPCLCPNTASSQQRRGSHVRTVTFGGAVVQPQPLQALKYLDHLLEYGPCRTILVDSCRPQLMTLAACLKNVCSVIERRVHIGAVVEGGALTDELLVMIFERYLRLEVLLNKQDQSHDSAVAAVEHQLTWIDSLLVPGLSRMEKESRRKRGRRLLAAGDCTLMANDLTLVDETLGQTVLMSDTSAVAGVSGSMDSAKNLIKNIIEKFSLIALDMMLVGIFDKEMLTRLGDFSLSLLRVDDGMTFLPLVVSLTYRMSSELHQSHSAKVTDADDVEEDEGVGCSGYPLPRVFTEIVNNLLTLYRKQTANFQKLMTQCRQPIIDTFVAIFNRKNPQENAMTDVMSTVTAAVMTVMMNAVHQNDRYFEAHFAELPPLAAFFIAMLVKQKNIASMFISEFELVCQSDVTDAAEGLIACLHVINAASSGRHCTGETVKHCLQLLHGCVDKVANSTSAPDDSRCGRLVDCCRELLKACCHRLQITV